jgi:hypothetical protein
MCFLKKEGDSQFWKSVLDIKDVYCANRKMIIGNGCSTSFWCDTWCGDTPSQRNITDLSYLLIKR